jgi:hypothetical protein
MPHLELLKGLSRDEASKLLAAAARILSPHADEHLPLPVSAQDAKKLLARLKEALGLSSEEEDDTAQGRLHAAITQMICEVLLSPDSFEAAVNRASSKGQLPVNAYEISKHSDFPGVRPNQIDGAVRSPDLIRHITSEEDISHSFPQFSLFAKYSKPAFGFEDRWLIVSAARLRRRLEVYSAWWVFPSLSGRIEYNDPLEVLLSFLELFGLDIRCGDQASRFIERADIPFNAATDPPEIPLEVLGAVRRYLISGVARWDEEHRIYSIRMAYAVDIVRYENFLRSKGIPTTSRFDRLGSRFAPKAIEALVRSDLEAQ